MRFVHEVANLNFTQNEKMQNGRNFVSKMLSPALS